MSDIFDHEWDAYDQAEGMGWDFSPGPYRRRRVIDHDYYHKLLFSKDELPATIVHETAKAKLIKVPRGLFWVPISLLRHQTEEQRAWKVHQCFKRTYLVELPAERKLFDPETSTKGFEI